jgi:hypothetical protein
MAFPFGIKSRFFCPSAHTVVTVSTFLTNRFHFFLISHLVTYRGNGKYHNQDTSGKFQMVCLV